jgi:hypothetical protein
VSDGLKLFQIEEPDGSPSDSDIPGAAIGIDACGPLAEVAFAIGGNAVVLTDREGFECDIPVPAVDAAAETWQPLFEGVRMRAERRLGRPVTHAVLALAIPPDQPAMLRLMEAADAAGIELLMVRDAASLAPAPAERRALAAAMLAEDAAPFPPGPG